MAHDKTKYFFKPTTQKLIAAAFAVFINVALFSLVGALFATDFRASSGRVLS
jgi:hypothetical protein